MPNSFICRLLTVGDAEQFRNVRLYGLQESPHAFLEDYTECADQPLEYFHRYFKNGWIAGAFRDGRLIGIAGLYIQKGIKLHHKGMVWGVYIMPESRGQGLAKQLIAMLIEEAQKARLELVQLSTDESKSSTVRLYTQLGFEVYGREQHIMKVANEYVTDVLMVKFL